MDESILLKASIVSSIAGLIVLYFIAGSMEADEVSISRITMGEADGFVSVKGKVSRITEKEEIMIFDLQKDEKISVLIFKKDYPGYIGLEEGDIVEVEGNVEEYQGKKEIVAENVRFMG